MGQAPIPPDSGEIGSQTCPLNEGSNLHRKRQLRYRPFKPQDCKIVFSGGSRWIGQARNVEYHVLPEDILDHLKEKPSDLVQ